MIRAFFSSFIIRVCHVMLFFKLFIYFIFLLILFYFIFAFWTVWKQTKEVWERKREIPEACPRITSLLQHLDFFSLSFCLVCLKQMLIWEERNLCLVRNDCHWNWWDDEKKLVQIQLKFLSCLLKCAIFIIFIWESLLTVVTVCDPSKFHWNVCLCVFMRNDQKVWTFEL